MTPLSQIPDGERHWTALASTVIAVLCRRVDGWCVYVGGVVGIDHRREWEDVARHGDKLSEPVAIAVAAVHFGFEPDVPYAY